MSNAPLAGYCGAATVSLLVLAEAIPPYPTPGTRVRLKAGAPYASWLRAQAVGEVVAEADSTPVFVHSLRGPLLRIRFAEADCLPGRSDFYQGNQTLNFTEEMEVVTEWAE